MEVVWVKVRVEEECFWVNLREDNKVFESKMAVSESNMAEFKMAAIIKLSQNEQVKFFYAKWLNTWWPEFKMAAIIKLSQNEWLWVRLNKKWVRVLCKMAESQMAEFKMVAIIQLVRLN